MMFGSGDPQYNPFRKAAFIMGLLLLFLRISMLHQIQHVVMGFSARLLYVVGILALLGLVMAGGIPRAFRGRPTIYWTAFAFWLILAVPFSSWKGGSAQSLFSYLRVEFIMLFVIAGLTITWRECKLVMYTIAWGAVVNILSARLFMQESLSGRLGLRSSTVANPNDFAGHLFLTLPFLLWVALSSRWLIIRMVSLLGVSYGIYVILRSGSRGAFVALLVVIGFYLLRATTRQRIVLLAGAPIAIAVALSMVPETTLHRLISFSASTNEPGVAAEAAESSRTRTYLMKTAIHYALQKPIFGVGQGQFSTYEGSHGTVVGGFRGEYEEVHNTYLAAASECGIPAFIFYMAGIISAFRLLVSSYRQVRKRPEYHDIRVAVFCILLAMVGFCTVVTFLNFTYFFYFPMMAGLSVAVFYAVEAEIQSRSAAPLGSPAAENSAAVRTQAAGAGGGDARFSPRIA